MSQDVHHRADIEGLRGLAVLLVLAFHARLPGFHGGFVGVDVFLVISGYVITAMLLREMASGRFSYAAFLRRRARRLMPVALLVCATTFLVAWWLMGPQDFRTMAGSAIAMLTLWSNVYFWGRADYFAQQQPDQPLLHTWSLSLEEQFYLLFPLALVAATRLIARKRLASFATVALLSFGACVALSGPYPGASFYLLPTRAWEFLVGALLALPGPHVQATTARVAAWARSAGWLLILTAVVGLSGGGVYPGVSAGLPVAGAAALIWGGTRGGHRLEPLNWPPMQALGRLSYSLYLWHWPVFALGRYATAAELTAPQTAGALLLTGLLSWWSFHVVEKPLRGRGASSTLGERVGAMVVAGGAALLALAIWSFSQQGLPQRLPQTVVALHDAALHRPAVHRDSPCHHGPPAEPRAENLCRLGAQGSDNAKAVALWGDSHANALAPVLDRLGRQSGIPVLQASFSSCPPLLGAKVAVAPRGGQCARFNAMVLRTLRDMEVRHVVLAAHWSAYLRPRPMTDLERWLDIYDRPGDLASYSLEANARSMRTHLQETLLALTAQGIDVWIVDQVPVHEGFVPLLLARASAAGRALDSVAVDLASHRRQSAAFGSVVSSVAKGYSIIDPSLPLCPAGRCLAALDGQALYIDSHHLSAAGSYRLAGILEPVFARAVGDGASAALR